MAKDLRLDVVTSKDGKALAELAVEFEALAKEVDHTGASMKDSATFSQFLDGQLKKQQATVRQLGEEFKRTGDQDVFANLRNASKGLKSLERYSKDIAKATATGLEDGAKEGGKSLLQVFKDLPQQIKEVAIPTAIAAAIIGSPAIGAAIDGVLLAGVGLGGLAAGIVGQIHDPGVEKAFGGVADTAMSVLTESTKAFAGPLAGIGEKIQSDLLKAEPKLEAAFDRLAPHLTALFTGAEGLFKEAAPGFLEALQASGPILDELGQDLPGLGHAFSTFFHSISQGEPGARDALHALFIITEATVEGLGYLTEGLSKTYTGLEAVGSLAKGDLGGFARKMADLTASGPKVADAVGHIAAIAGAAKTDFAGLAQQIGATKVNADTLAGAMSGKIFDQLMSADHATLGWYESLNSLKDALSQNGKTLDITTQKGEANREAILNVIAANVQAYQTNIASGVAATVAAADYDKNTESLRKQLTQAGYTKTEIDGLINKYAGVPDAVNTTIAIEGLTQAISDLDDLIAKINNIPGAHIEIQGHKYTTQSAADTHHGYAAGGRFPAGKPMIVGEKGPELMLPNFAGTVIPNDALRSLSTPPPSFRARPTATASSGNGTLQVTGNADSLFFSMLQEAVRVGALQLVTA